MIPYLGLRHRRAVIYSQPVDRFNRPMKSTPPPDWDTNKEKAYSGNMTKGSVTRLKKAFENLIEISEWKDVKAFRDVKQPGGGIKKEPYQIRFRLNFITLTLPAPQGEITDRQIYNECFKPWIDALRYKCPDISYCWKAEVQKNGNLHFHITTDRFVDYRWIRNCWNKQVAKLGFIRAFAKEHGHSDPNSTDVEQVKNDSNLGAYMAKYVCKVEEDKRDLGIKVWDCSRNLKFKETRNLPICNELNEWIDKLIRSERVQVIRTEQAIILQSNAEWDTELLPRSLRESHKRYLALLRDTTCKYQRLYNEGIEQIKSKSRPAMRGDRSSEVRETIRGASSHVVDQLKFDFSRFNHWRGVR